MKYITFPADKLKEVPQEVLNELHLSPRHSVDGTEIIMKVVNYEKLFPSVQTLPLADNVETTEVAYPYPVYEGEELEQLLASAEWTEAIES